jgi:hypothetical protein
MAPVRNRSAKPAEAKHNKKSSAAGKENSENKKAAKAVLKKRAPFATVKNSEKPPSTTAAELEAKPIETIRFRWLFAKHQPVSNDSLLQFFPPTVHTDVEYSAGIRLDFINTMTLEECPTACQTALVEVSRHNYCNRQNASSVAPILNVQQADLWTHKFAATAAVHWQFPASANRLLGTITRTITVPADAPCPQQLVHQLQCPAAKHPCARGARKLQTIPPMQVVVERNSRRLPLPHKPAATRSNLPSTAIACCRKPRPRPWE